MELKAHYPALTQSINDRPLVYLDSAATALMPQCVIDRVNRYHAFEHSNVHRGIHTLSQNATDAYEEVRDRTMAFIGASDRSEVVFTTGTTDSINLMTFTLAGRIGPEDRILVSEMEHHANIVPWQQLCAITGARMEVIPMDDRGDIDLDAYRRQLDAGSVAWVAMVHVSNALGTVNPIEDMVVMAHEAGAKVLVDAAQSAAHMRLDVRSMGCDALAFSAHKLGGPTGFGILYARKELLDGLPPFRTGGGMVQRVDFDHTTFADAPGRFEAGTPPIAAGIGFGEALRFMDGIGFDAIERIETEVTGYALDRLGSMERVTLIGQPRKRSVIVPFIVEGIHAMDIGMVLDRHGVAIRTGHHCAQPVLRRFNVPATIRASFAFYNTQEEVDRLADAIRDAIRFFD